MAVAVFHPPAQIAVPMIIGISLAMALALTLVMARPPAGVSEFGLKAPGLRYVGLAVLIGLPLALAAGGLDHLFPSKGPISTAGFPPWMPWLYFGLGASIQEEVIFRGLIQSVLEQAWNGRLAGLGASLSPAVGITAVLFAVVHLDSGPAVVASAMALGLVAGELRRRSGSLLPAVIVHALFNLPDLLWP